jgi:hypothetical protein
MGVGQMPKCPCCLIDIDIKPIITKDGDIRVGIVDAETNYNILIVAVLGYMRWCTEGNKPYKKQYYYDNYHSAIHYNEDTNEYTFNIQTYDSPMGDTWWSGTFKFDGPSIKIIDAKYSKH